MEHEKKKEGKAGGFVEKKRGVWEEESSGKKRGPKTGTGEGVALFLFDCI